jgi:hypothetical protein
MITPAAIATIRISKGRSRFRLAGAAGVVLFPVSADAGGVFSATGLLISFLFCVL